MEFIIEDIDGRIIGCTDMEGSRWIERGSHFENLETIIVTINRRGKFGRGYFKSGNGQIGGQVNLTNPYLDVGDQLRMPPNEISITVHEQHLDVSDWMRSASSAPSSAEFATDALADAYAKAKALEELVKRSPPWDVMEMREAVHSLASSVYDLHASLSITAKQ